jgi:hypothetical protein
MTKEAAKHEKEAVKREAQRADGAHDFCTDLLVYAKARLQRPGITDFQPNRVRL